MKIFPPAASTAAGDKPFLRLTTLTNSTATRWSNWSTCVLYQTANMLVSTRLCLPYGHRRLLSYLRSVSAGLSKLFCPFNSDTNSSFAASSSGVGRIVEIGGVTPHWRLDGAAMLGCVVPLMYYWHMYRLAPIEKSRKEEYRINSDRKRKREKTKQTNSPPNEMNN